MGEIRWRIFANVKWILFIFYENVCKHKHTYRGIFTWNHRPQGDIYTKRTLHINKFFLAEECKDFYVLLQSVAAMCLILISKIYEFQATKLGFVFVILLLDYTLFDCIVSCIKIIMRKLMVLLVVIGLCWPVAMILKLLQKNG